MDHDSKNQPMSIYLQEANSSWTLDSGTVGAMLWTYLSPSPSLTALLKRTLIPVSRSYETCELTNDKIQRSASFFHASSLSILKASYGKLI